MEVPVGRGPALTHPPLHIRHAKLNRFTPATDCPSGVVGFVARLRSAGAESWVIWGAFVAAVVIAIWSAPRGFDFLDTGCYFLEYKYPDDVADRHTTYRLFARPFFLLVGESVAGFRYVSWLLVWVSAAVMAWGWTRYLSALYHPERSPMSVGRTVGMFLLASCAVYTIKPAALTYNSLNFVAVAIALGLLFDGAGRFIRQESGWTGVVEVAAAALVATVDLLIKPTTAAFVCAVIVGYCVVSPGITFATKKRLALVAAVGGVLGTGAMIIFVGGIDPFLERIRTLTSILDNRAYMDELNTRTIREFREIGAFLARDLKFAGPAVLLTGIVTAFARRRPDVAREIAALAGFVVFGLWAYSTYEAKLWRGSHQLYFDGIVARLYLGAALLATLAAIVSWLVVPRDRRPTTSAKHVGLKLIVWTILMTTPFAGAYGSTTSVYLNGALYAVCWLAALFLAFGELMLVWNAPRLIRWATVPFAFYAVAQLYHGQIQMPYMNNRPLWEQNVPTQLGTRGSIVLLDRPSADCINTTREILTRHGFQPGDDIFCFFNVPGLVYAVGGRSPIIPWYFGRIYVENPVEEIHMQAAGPERRARAWIITQAEVTQFREHFQRGGINFPDGYEEIGALMNPQSGLELKIWKPRKAGS
jgi:hypothetical protein